MSNLKILVCGSRDYTDESFMRSKLNAIVSQLGVPANQVEVIVGGAKGADTIAERLARKWGWPVTVYKADWQAEPKRAGYLRNERMLNEGKHHVVLAFFGPSGTDSPGTSHMVDYARKRGYTGWTYRPHLNNEAVD